MNNKKSLLILSITGIILVVISLTGVTYAYYATRVNGNNTEKSMDIVTVNKSLTYTDLSEVESSETIAPGYEYVKLFTIKNTGTGSSTYSIYLDDVINEYIRTQDITYILYRKNGNDTIDINDFSDCTIVARGTYPKFSSYIKVDEIIPKETEYYTYAFYVTYENAYENQDIDQGKIFSGKIQIHTHEQDPLETNTLANKIISSAQLAANESSTTRTQFVEPASLPTTPGVKISDSTEKVLSYTEDDYTTITGNDSYYFRGNVIDNYLEFNGMCWRIVRIEGDGSIKIVLAAQKSCASITDADTATAFVQQDVYGHAYYANELSWSTNNPGDNLNDVFADWFNGTLSDGTTLRFSSENKNKLKSTSLCTGNLKNRYKINGDLLTETELAQQKNDEYFVWYYSNYFRLIDNNNVSLVCEEQGKTDNYYQVYPLTADEVIFAGGKIAGANSSFYLMTNSISYDEVGWWLLTPSYVHSGDADENAMSVSDNGSIYNGSHISDSYGSARPSVSLKPNTLYSGGSGLKTDPYIIK